MVRFLVERRLKIIDSFFTKSKTVSMTTQLSNFKSYSGALSYGDLKRNRYRIVYRNRYDYCS